MSAYGTNTGSIDLGPVEEAYNLDDFKQLDALFEGVEVVMLWEQTHGEGVVKFCIFAWR